MSSSILETERLSLRKFTHEDADFIIELVNSSGWIKFIGDKNVKTKEQAIDYLENGPLKSYRENGFGLSMVERREDGKSIGMCGLLKREHLETPDIGFALLPDHYGKGYAHEIAGATVFHAKTYLSIPKICAITLAENTRSIRLLEKLGLRFIKTFCFPGKNEELQLYSN